MIWIIIAIVIAALIIAEAIKSASNTKIIADAKLQEAKLESEKVLSPAYRKKIDLSLEFMEYCEEYNSHTRAIYDAKETLLKGRNLTEVNILKYINEIKSNSGEREKLKYSWDKRWDKLPKQDDPRRHLYVQHPEVSIRWEAYQKEMEEFSERGNNISILKKHNPDIAKRISALGV